MTENADDRGNGPKLPPTAPVRTPTNAAIAFQHEKEGGEPRAKSGSCVCWLRDPLGRLGDEREEGGGSPYAAGFRVSRLLADESDDSDESSDCWKKPIALRLRLTREDLEALGPGMVGSSCSNELGGDGWAILDACT